VAVVKMDTEPNRALAGGGSALRGVAWQGAQSSYDATIPVFVAGGYLQVPSCILEKATAGVDLAPSCS
jgi:hypothetical protein